VDKIVIDAGHGGKDSGTVGSISKEKDVALKIALELGRIIKDNLPDVEIIYTRNKDNFVELEDRAMLANKNDADLFISIHCNAVPANKSQIYGTETYIMGVHKDNANFEIAKRENSVILLEENYEERYEGFDPNSPESNILFSLYQNAYLENSLNLADKIEYQFSKRVGRNSRGVRQAGFWVLWRTSMPSVLIETGYLSNPKEERYLNDKLGQVYLASGIYRAFRDFKQEIESSY
jgi:N-acetylmuramoyl-L-alanine amidase